MRDELFNMVWIVVFGTRSSAHKRGTSRKQNLISKM